MTFPRPATVAAFAGLALAAPAAAQEYAIASPAGDSVAFELSELRVMLDTARALYRDLEEDPRVLYRLGFREPVPAGAPQPAYPWNAVEPESDSTVTVLAPGNLREADRAYHNYAVMRMREIRSGDPDDPCDALVAREADVLSGFVDGWILARTLFGGPAYVPLDELAFARAAGHLPALLVERGDTAVAGCLEEWAGAHDDEIAAYRAWRANAFPGLAGAGDEPAADSADAPGGDRDGDEPPPDEAPPPDETPSGPSSSDPGEG